MTDLQKYGTKLMRSLAADVSAGISTGHDWPNSQNELTRLQSAQLLREAADEVDRLRGQRAVMIELLADAANAIHNLPDEVETQDEADMLRRLRDKIADTRNVVLLEMALRA